jgi:hypothetical protein
MESTTTYMATSGPFSVSVGNIEYDPRGVILGSVPLPNGDSAGTNFAFGRYQPQPGSHRAGLLQPPRLSLASVSAAACASDARASAVGALLAAVEKG